MFWNRTWINPESWRSLCLSESGFGPSARRQKERKKKKFQILKEEILSGGLKAWSLKALQGGQKRNIASFDQRNLNFFPRCFPISDHQKPRDLILDPDPPKWLDLDADSLNMDTKPLSRGQSSKHSIPHFTVAGRGTNNSLTKLLHSFNFGIYQCFGSVFIWSGSRILMPKISKKFTG